MKTRIPDHIDAKLTPCTAVFGEDMEDDELLREMISRAREYLDRFSWNEGILECYVGDIAVGGVVVVVLFRIQPEREDVDEWLWVIVGDLPPAYLVTDDNPDATAALEAYIDEMKCWVDAVRTGKSIDNLIPVETSEGSALREPTLEVADELDSRLRFLEENLLPSRRQGQDEATG